MLKAFKRTFFLSFFLSYFFLELLLLFFLLSSFFFLLFSFCEKMLLFLRILCWRCWKSKRVCGGGSDGNRSGENDDDDARQQRGLKQQKYLTRNETLLTMGLVAEIHRKKYVVRFMYVGMYVEGRCENIQICFNCFLSDFSLDLSTYIDRRLQRGLGYWFNLHSTYKKFRRKVAIQRRRKKKSTIIDTVVVAL